MNTFSLYYFPFPLKASKAFVSALPGILLLLLAGCRQTEVAPKKAADLVPNVHLTLGNPSNATTDQVQVNNYLIERRQYALSYSRDRGTPNWVSWHICTGWLGSTPCQDDFSAQMSCCRPTGSGPSQEQQDRDRLYEPGSKPDG